jgi:hypothetical protein
VNIKSLLLATVWVLTWDCSARSATLLTAPDASEIQTWLDATGLYSGSLQFTNIYEESAGDTPTTFHSAVDGKGPTITLMSVTFGNQTAVIGGFDPQSWSSSTGYNMVSDPAQRTAFIYNLTTGLLQPETSAASGAYQTSNYSGYGPAFGGGYDIGLYNGSLNNGYAFAYSYGSGCVNDCEANGNILGLSGQTFFSVGQLEVFTISEAVPEPSTWAMMILGFAGIGFMAYRRRNNTGTLRVA